MESYTIVFRGKRNNKVTFVFKYTGGTALDKQTTAANAARLLTVRLKSVGINISEAELRAELLDKQKEFGADLTHFETNGTFA